MNDTLKRLDEIEREIQAVPGTPCGFEAHFEWLVSLVRAGVKLAAAGDGACELLDENNRHDRQHIEFHKALAAFRAAEGRT